MVKPSATKGRVTKKLVAPTYFHDLRFFRLRAETLSRMVLPTVNNADHHQHDDDDPPHKVDRLLGLNKHVGHLQRGCHTVYPLDTLDSGH